MQYRVALLYHAENEALFCYRDTLAECLEWIRYYWGSRYIGAVIVTRPPGGWSK